MPEFAPLRQDEDWRELANRTGLPLHLRVKYVRLGAPDRWLTLGGEWRTWYERFRHEGWEVPTTDPGGYLLQRLMVHADVHLSPRVRTFVQLKSGLERGRTGGPTPTMRDDLDLNQLFVDVDLGRTTPADDLKTSFRIGRQEVRLGRGRLVDVREGTNVRFGNDGLRVRLESGASRVELYALRPTATRPGVFDDGWTDGRWLWSAYGTLGGVLPGRGALELYYVGNARPRAVFVQDSGQETRHTIGTRAAWRRGPLDADVEATLQIGRVGRTRVRALLLAGHAFYQLPGALHPVLNFYAGLASGDADPTDGVIGTFAPPQPRGTYFAQINAVGPYNIMTLRPGVTIAPAASLSLAMDAFVQWRHRAADAVYDLPGFRVRAPNPGRPRFLGVQPQIEATWQASRLFAVTVNYGVYLGATSLDAPTPAPTADYAAAWATFRF